MRQLVSVLVSATFAQPNSQIFRSCVASTNGWRRAACELYFVASKSTLVERGEIICCSLCSPREMQVWIGKSKMGALSKVVSRFHLAFSPLKYIDTQRSFSAFRIIYVYSHYFVVYLYVHMFVCVSYSSLSLVVWFVGNIRSAIYSSVQNLVR